MRTQPWAAALRLDASRNTTGRQQIAIALVMAANLATSTEDFNNANPLVVRINWRQPRRAPGANASSNKPLDNGGRDNVTVIVAAYRLPELEDPARTTPTA
jgi:hypothetical protein